MTRVGNRYGQGNDLFGQQIQLAGLHDCFEARPAKFQVIGMTGQSTPDVWDALDFLGRLDILKDPADLGVVGIFFHKTNGTHAMAPRCDGG
jgi:hypothetical protein